MNQTDLSLIDAHIEVELERLNKLLMARYQIYQHMPTGEPLNRHLETYRHQLAALISLTEGKLITASLG
ncbi:MAG TPA: hypothetical protein DE179_01060 [Oceanospirillaceae bacterium]|nr:hypothetical protein [Oceanospirillaceae bacterium]